MQSVNTLWSECDQVCQTTSELSLVLIVFGAYVSVNAIRTTCRHLHTQRHHPTLTCDCYDIILHCTERRKNCRVLMCSPLITPLSHPQRPINCCGIYNNHKWNCCLQCHSCFLFASDKRVLQMTPQQIKKEEISHTVKTFLVTAHLPCWLPKADLPRRQRSCAAYTEGQRSDLIKHNKNTRCKCKGKIKSLIICLTHSDTDHILIPGVNGVRKINMTLQLHYLEIM